MAKGKREVKNSNAKVVAIILISILIIAGVIFGITKLISKGENNNQQSVSTEDDITGNKYEVEGKKLIAYFSNTGNTITVASLINRKIGGDMFKIQPVERYSYNYDDTLKRAEQEKKENARPELSEKIDNIDEYDTVFLGYPIWLDTVPMIIHTFLDTYNLDGKTIIPFCTSNEGSLGTSVEDIKNAEPNATVLNGLSIVGSNVGEDATKSKVDIWIEGIQQQLKKDE